jgi:hypothetical protein
VQQSTASSIALGNNVVECANPADCKAYCVAAYGPNRKMEQRNKWCLTPDAEEVLGRVWGAHAHARPEGVPEDDLTIWAMKPEELSAYDWTGEGMTVEIARAGILDKVDFLLFKVESGPAVKAWVKVRKMSLSRDRTVDGFGFEPTLQIAKLASTQGWQ